MTVNKADMVSEFQNPAGPVRDVFRFQIGFITLVAGTGTDPAPGFSNPKVLVSYFQFGGAQGNLRASVTAGTLTITSSSGTDTSTVSYLIVE